MAMITKRQAQVLKLDFDAFIKRTGLQRRTVCRTLGCTPENIGKPMPVEIYNSLYNFMAEWDKQNSVNYDGSEMNQLIVEKLCKLERLLDNQHEVETGLRLDETIEEYIIKAAEAFNVPPMYFIQAAIAQEVRFHNKLKRIHGDEYQFKVASIDLPEIL